MSDVAPSRVVLPDSPRLQPEPTIAEVRVGLIGGAFMAKAHSIAYAKIPLLSWPSPTRPVLMALAAESSAEAQAAAQRYGYRRAYEGWRKLVEDPEIELVDNSGPPFIHAEACIAAAEAGKSVLCEKPLGRNAAESRRMRDAVIKAGVKHGCGFVYRFAPAIRLARMLIEQGKLGRIYHFRMHYLQEWLANPLMSPGYRITKELAGSGVLGNVGSHMIDLARYLVGEPKYVNALTRTFITERPSATRPGQLQKVEVEDAFVGLIEYENGAIGTLEASGMARGRKNSAYWEINGEKGSLAFDLERMNELQVFLPEEQDSALVAGFTNVLVSDSSHPFLQAWWPSGFVIGWADLFVNYLQHFISAMASDTPVEPLCATFEDGYRAAVVCDALAASAADGGARVDIRY